MRRRGLRRFALEVLFLAGVAVAVTVAELQTAGVIALMAVAWVVVALLEWTAWLDEPHYGRGLPPRYYVPQVALPPPRAVEQGALSYPAAPSPAVRRPPPAREPDVDDAPTFERPAAEWASALGAWPVLDTTAEEETMIAISGEVEADAPSAIVPLPPVVGIEETVEHQFVYKDEEEDTAEDVTEAEEEPEPIVAAVAAAAILVEPEVSLPEPEPVAAPAPPPPALPVPVRVDLVTTHRVDPLVSASRRRFLFLRGGGEELTVDVADGPPPDRELPPRVLEQAKAARQ